MKYLRNMQSRQEMEITDVEKEEKSKDVENTRPQFLHERVNRNYKQCHFSSVISKQGGNLLR